MNIASPKCAGFASHVSPLSLGCGRETLKSPDALQDAFDVFVSDGVTPNLLDCVVSDMYGCYRDTLMGTELGSAGMAKLEQPMISSGDELFPGATGIELLDADEVESSSFQCGGWLSAGDAAEIEWCSSSFLETSDSRLPSPGTPDSMQSHASDHSAVGSQQQAQQQPWQPDLHHELCRGAYGDRPVARDSDASTNSLARSAAGSMASLTSLLGGYQEAAAAVPNPNQDSRSCPSALASPAALPQLDGPSAKRIIVRPRRAAAFVPTLPVSPRGKKRGAPGGQPCKVAPNPDGHACTACGAQSTPVWRAGPHGPKTLCNACGVRYMKVAKKK